jgi:hypothetical protein
MDVNAVAVLVVSSMCDGHVFGKRDRRSLAHTITGVANLICVNKPAADAVIRKCFSSDCCRLLQYGNNYHCASECRDTTPHSSEGCNCCGAGYIIPVLLQ